MVIPMTCLVVTVAPALSLEVPTLIVTVVVQEEVVVTMMGIMVAMVEPGVRQEVSLQVTVFLLTTRRVARSTLRR